MKIRIKYYKGSIFALAKRIGAEFVAVTSEDEVIIDRFHRSISDCSGNISIENSPEAVSRIVGKEVIRATTEQDLEIFVAKELCPELEDCSKYLGTGGGLQAQCWAENKKKLVKVLNTILPEKDRIKKIRVWSGGDFNDMKIINLNWR